MELLGFRGGRETDIRREWVLRVAQNTRVGSEQAVNLRRQEDACAGG